MTLNEIAAFIETDLSSDSGDRTDAAVLNPHIGRTISFKPRQNRGQSSLKLLIPFLILTIGSLPPLRLILLIQSILSFRVGAGRHPSALTGAFPADVRNPLHIGIGPKAGRSSGIDGPDSPAADRYDQPAASQDVLYPRAGQLPTREIYGNRLADVKSHEIQD